MGYAVGDLSYIKRDIYKDMLEWKESLERHKTSLEIEGARQVGKSFIVRKFAEENFQNVYVIDLFEQEDCEKMERAKELNLSNREMIYLFFPDFKDESTSILIIDEVQEYVRAYNLIKPMALEMKAQLIVTGSFLGKTLKKGYFQAGAERIGLVMRSLSFPEFLAVFKLRELYEQIDLYGDSPHEDYEKIKGLYYLYLRIGGCPRVIIETLKSNDFAVADRELGQIVEMFCKDSERYFDNIIDIGVLPRLLSGVTSFLLRDKRGLVRERDELLKMGMGDTTVQQSIKRCLGWLNKSHFISPCDKCLDLDFNADILSMRYYFTDVGIAQYMFSTLPNESSNRTGRLAENFVFRTILDQRTFRRGMVYFGTYGDLEIDFFDFVQDGLKVKKIAVEVKSSTGKGKSASKLLNSKKIDYLIYAKGDTYGGKSGNILTIPIYLFGRFHIDQLVPPDPETELNKLLSEIHVLRS